MTLEGQRISSHLRLGLFTLIPILIVSALLVVLPPDGNDRAEWAQFIGRFHPLAVHFPIALILLVPILELAGLNARFSYLRLSVGFVLGLATVSAAAAGMLGWCLARSGGYSGPIVIQHMWGGASLAAVSWLCWRLRARANPSNSWRLYATALATAVALVVWTGYRGGQLAQGEDHMTEHMPVTLRKLLRISKGSPSLQSVAQANTFYGARIQPIFADRCMKCHGADKHKGNLRLDSYNSLMRGAKHGPVVRGGNVQNSELFRRITLSPDHDDFMPKSAKRPLSKDQVKMVELWIAAGASGTLPTDAIQYTPDASAAAPADVTFPEVDAAAVANLRAGLAPVLAQLQKRFPNSLEYESRGSADLRLNASILGMQFGDRELATLSPLFEHITTADLSRTAITDQSASALAAMKQLRVLRLVHTSITDITARQFAALNQLESLNVFDTRITAASLPTISRLPKLVHVYAGQTAIPIHSSLPQELAGKLVF